MDYKEQQSLQEEFKTTCEEFYVALKEYRDYQIATLMQENLAQLIQSSSVLYDNYQLLQGWLPKGKGFSQLQKALCICKDLPIDCKNLKKSLKKVKKPSRALINKYLYKMIAEGCQLQITKQSYAIENALATFLGREGFSYPILDLANCKLSPGFSKAYQEQDQK